MLYNEEEYLQLSGIQHFAFCRRQWALAYIELQWSENVRTVEGKLLHEKAHDVTSEEKRGDLIISRAMPIHSRELGVSGECDIVEFHRSGTGITLSGRDGTYEAVPIEYKRGSPKQNDVDILQLTAQAMCLEEMLCCEIPYGYLYYGETRHRSKVVFEESIRQKVRDSFREMHQYYERRYTPRVKRTRSCNACSLKDFCLPVLGVGKSASSYIDKALSQED
ncbi:CRISPR-associated protein Cas4 [[Clostridium] hylemonae]|uniref:CRISPR-associated protein Cas4 n=1 Tax=[Clostridium] hylemonae TaxID=89153 RepID=UPI002FE6A98C